MQLVIEPQKTTFPIYQLNAAVCELGDWIQILTSLANYLRCCNFFIPEIWGTDAYLAGLLCSSHDNAGKTLPMLHVHYMVTIIHD